MKRYFVSLVLAGLVASVVGNAQEDFTWSWEDDATDKAAVTESEQPADAAVEPAAEVETPEAETFDWSFDEKGSGKATETARGDADAANKLLQENLELRHKISEMEQESQSVRKENARLAREVEDFEARIQDMVVVIDDLKKKKAAASETPDKMIDLESQVVAAENEKARLGRELAEAKRQMAEARSGEVATMAAAEGAPIKPGSDLFRKIEEENAKLKQKLLDLAKARRVAQEESESLEAERAKALKRSAQAEEELAQTKSKVSEIRRVSERLAKQVPSMQKQIEKLRDELDAKEDALGAKQEDLAALKDELARREHRMMQIERVEELLGQARQKVQAVNDREKRDMHYNMAVVYSDRGLYAEAEQEYLRALQLDPQDADVHYNLGILYDDYLHNRHKAEIHYRRFIKLRPHDKNIDKVRQWIMRLNEIPR